jgi:uncharacterized protein (TIGR00266 family)
MRVELKYAPSGTAAICHLDAGDVINTQGGALLAMRGNVDMQTTTHQKSGGGLMAGMKRLLSGASFFINRYKAVQPSEVWLGTALPGDIVVHELKGEKLVIQGGGYIACEENVNIDLEWQGMKSLFSGESLFWLKAHGQGKVILGSFGFIYPIQVKGEYIVDTGHIVAFEETLNFTISKASRSWIQSLLSGEGFICRFKGQGTVWCQSHNPRAFGQELTPHLRVKNN